MVDGGPFRWAKSSDPRTPDVIALAARSDVDGLTAEVRDLDDRVSERGRMHSVVLAAFEPDGSRCAIAQMGDARAYLFRPTVGTRELPAPMAPRFCPEVNRAGGGQLVCLTWDHSTACDLVEMELLDRSEGRRRARRRVLTRGLGAEPATRPDVLFVELEPGDRLLLCSADVWLAVDDRELADVLATEPDVDAACRALAERAPSGRHALMVIEATGGAAATRHRAAPAELLRYGRDLTAWARAQSGPISGRKHELRALIRALLRMNKPNALIVGEPGVGKTWLVEALARTLLGPGCPDALREVCIVELSVSALLAGARYRGDFEERLERVLAEVRADPRLVVFIDELHLLVGAGAGTDGGVDAASLIKPALARGELRLIGATTPREFDRHLAADEAFLRRFEIVRIEEPSRSETLAILAAVGADLAAHHGVEIDEAAYEAAVDLSVRYLPERRLPDKAIDVLDQACTRSVSRWLSLSLGGGAGAVATPGQRVDADDVAAVIAERCRVPVELVRMDDHQRLTELARLLGQRVIGQEAALEVIAAALQRGYRGLGEPERPIASLALVGPTGVGKTATARSIAELLFDSADALLRIDMSEYSERHAVSRLLGAPPGYVGHDRDGELIAALRARPARVVLFDEIEKAHPDVLMVLLQILDAGWVKGSRGSAVSFRDAVVILTSNLAATAQPRAVGFGAASTTPPSEADARRVLENHLPRELVGRIGAVVQFAELSQEALTAIAERHLLRVAERLATSGALRAAPPTLREHVLGTVRGGRYGARDIERAVEDAVGAWLDAQASGGGGVDHLGARPRANVAGLLLQGADDREAAAVVARIQRSEAVGLLYLARIGANVLAVFDAVADALACARGQAGVAAVVEVGRVERSGGGGLSGPLVDQLFRLAAEHPGEPLTLGEALKEPSRAD